MNIKITKLNIKVKCLTKMKDFFKITLTRSEIAMCMSHVFKKNIENI